MVWYSRNEPCGNDSWAARAPLAFAWPLLHAHDLAEVRARAYADEKRASLLVEVPGRGVKDVEVRVEGRRLTLALAELAPVADAPAQRVEREIPRRAIERTFTLPWPVALDSVRAALKDGLLAIELERAPESEPRRIAVQGS
jgi:HSP20 family molecular chaperone IbpA